MRNVSDDYEGLRLDEEGPARFSSEDLDHDLLNSANSVNDDSGKVPEISINDVLLEPSKIMIEASPPVAESPPMSSQERRESILLKAMSTIKEFPESEDEHSDEEEEEELSQQEQKEESRIVDSHIQEQTVQEAKLLAQLKELREEKLAFEA